MRFPRSSGLLLHPTSLPGRWGIGDLGPSAYQFVEFLVAAGQRIWQVLPLGPTGYGDSPYQCFSAFAGNPLLISLDRLAADGLLNQHELEEMAAEASNRLNQDYVAYGEVIPFKMGLLQHSFERLRGGAASHHRGAFSLFCTTHARWLDDYALFMALKAEHGGGGWDTWDRAVATRQSAALNDARERLATQIEFQKYLQYLFFHQWMPLKAYANQRGIRIIGDAPIFVAYDSADVWANPDLYFLDEEGNPTVVAGVPPDYFSATGQRWGNPLYRWDRMSASRYAWWLERIRSALTMVDILRIDHFRGFAAYWEIPASEETAVKGRWIPAPGAELFSTMERTLGEVPLIAEDLGVITPDVEELRDRFDFPGMKVLQFAFDGSSTNPYLPHNYRSNAVVYTGTHDNDTTLGWFQQLKDEERAVILRYMDRDGSTIVWDLIRLAMSSVADLAVFPLQDVLGLGSEARMNTPGHLGNNWAWRFREGAVDASLAERLRMLTDLYGRLGTH